MSLECVGVGKAGAGEGGGATKEEGFVGGMSPEEQAKFALDTLEQVRTKVDSWLTWETAYLQDAGLVYDGSSSRTRPSSYSAGISDDRHSTYSDPAPAVRAAEPSAGGPPAADAPQDPGDVPAAPDVVLTSAPGDPALVTASTHRGLLPSGVRDLAPAFVKLGGPADRPVDSPTNPGHGKDARRPLGKLDLASKQRADAVTVARLKAEETIASAAMQAVRGRAENYRVDVGQEAFEDPVKGLEAIMEWLRANRDSLRAHTGELDYDMSGTISTDELLELFRKVKFEPTPAELRSLLWKLDRDGSGSVTIDELLDSSDDEDHAAVFRQTALAPVFSREELKARTEKMARNQQHTLQRPNTSDGFLSAEQTQLVLQKLRAINVTNPLASATSGPPRGPPSSSGSALASSGSTSSRTGILKMSTMNRPRSVRNGTGTGTGKAGAIRGTSSSETTPRHASFKAGGGDTRGNYPAAEDLKRRPDSAPIRGGDERVKAKKEETRKSRIAFVDLPPENEENRGTGGMTSRPTSAGRGKVSGSVSLSRPLSSSGHRLR
ncbi:hypothetical protein KFL_000780190 [Klebsormidium nitens]|uniref:EF-hand domain-containing protein n=1 Tax=Klebsormidium nitens TaxID=105231 RepID=A0A1Y1HXT9_KLENI|nr:hypothetical protein KFL_000780190 [Klebsormidium nitens]|eukprot:GAQ81357.1 hypothetical protein KFL_000780190 [Klebsormidium nitens]